MLFVAAPTLCTTSAFCLMSASKDMIFDRSIDKEMKLPGLELNLNECLIYQVFPMNSRGSSSIELVVLGLIAALVVVLAVPLVSGILNSPHEPIIQEHQR